MNVTTANSPSDHVMIFQLSGAIVESSSTLRRASVLMTATTLPFVVAISPVSTVAAVSEVAHDHQDRDENEEPVVL